METDYDLIVAGAGPAGTACAITAARGGARVLLLDKSSFPRHKVCGEFVSSESLELLNSLLPPNLFDQVAQISRARIFVDGKILTIPVTPPARSIARFDLDAALLQCAVAAGVEFREQTTVSGIDQGETFCVMTSTGSISAKAVVNATGRWSQLTRFHPGNGDKWIGLKAHFAEPSPSQSVDLYFFDGGYCGVQPVGRNSVNACAMVKAERAASLEQVFRLHPELLARSREWQQQFPTVTTSALHFREPKTHDGGVFLAGDSAAFIDPFAGDGISLALHSGSLAAQRLSDFLARHCSLDQAIESYASAYRAQLTPALRNAGRIRRLLSAPSWARSALLAIARSSTVAEMLVRTTRVKAGRQAGS